MSESLSTTWILRLQRWAEADQNVRLALLVGSQARTVMPADPLSDIDLALFARDPDRLLRDESWISGLGPYWTSHLEGNALETGEERRVLFEDGQDVDFAVFPVEYLGALTTDARAATVLRRGFRPLVNKESVELIVPRNEPPPVLPSLSEFSNLVNDYWFHLVWTAKKLRRGELLTALEATNGYLRALLVRTVRWHSLSVGPRGQDVWHAARFFESWADPRVLRGFSGTVAQYDTPSVVRALRANRDMFSWVSHEIGQSLSFPQPIRDELGLSAYLDRMLDGTRS
ncbi:MAG TPA: aminoglycoside 6-adenylyltransferase [Thermoplasmata archaeon]|nr:aminoglycoside 6-adenylyltransferase [Thermoplasmata archaeon]